MLIGALVVLTCLVGTAARAHAQDPWDAILMVTPFPSPYLSDWETNPTIASLTVLNSGSQAQDVILFSEVRNQAGAVITVGRSDPQTIPPGVPVVYNDLTQIAGTQEHDPATEDLVQRSGRLPEGEYEACVTVTNLSGFVLAQACMDFTIVYPDPPMLIAPADGEVVSSAAPILQWTPLQVPPDYALQYTLQMAEVLAGQLPEAALSSNILHYENFDVGTTSFPYPVDGLALEPGKTYAWRVVAIDQNGYAAATNGGSSEIWTFTYDEGSGGEPETPSSSAVTLTLRNAPDDPSVTNPEEDPTTGLGEICSKWNLEQPVQSVSLPHAARFFPGQLTVSASLVRRGTGNKREWAMAGVRDSWSIVVYGDCGGPFEKTVVRWIGARRLSDTQELWQWLLASGAGDETPETTEDTPGAKLKFGVGIFSLFEMTAGEEGTLELAQEFLEGHEVDLQPGFNFFGIVDGNQVPLLQTIAEKLHTTTADFEIVGFAGLNTSLNAGVSLGQTADGASGVAADVGAQFVILRVAGALPAWENPGWDWIKSLQLGLEVVVQDSIAQGWGARDSGLVNSLEIVPAVTLTLVTSDDVTFTGTVGIDFAKNRGEAFNPHLVVKLSSDAKWTPGQLRGMDVFVGNPEIELDIEDLPDWKNIQQNGFGALEWSLSVSGSLGWGNEEAIAKLGVTFGRKADNPGEFWGDLVQKDSVLAKADSLLIERSRAGLAQAESRGDSAAADAFRTQLTERETRLAQTLRNLRANEGALKQWEDAKARGVEKPNPGAKKGAWWWKARLGFGNMGLLDFVDLIMKAVAGGGP